MNAQVLQFRPRVGKYYADYSAIPNVGEPAGVSELLARSRVVNALPSDVEQDTCSCPSCRERENVFPQPKEEPFSA